MLAVCPMPPESRPPRLRPPPSRFPWLVVLLAVLLVELCLLPLRAPQRPALPDVDGAVLVTQDHGWGNKPLEPRRIPAPGKGDPSWQRGNCADWQVEKSGYCWAPLDPAKVKPPCPGALYEDAGRCWAPVVKRGPDASMHR